jgi:RNA polymerase sigma-70 factor (ECF subfamily)
LADILSTRFSMADDLFELVRAARTGSSEARESLLAATRPKLREWAEYAINARFAGHVDASDLTQVTLLDLHRKLEDFAGVSEGEFIDWLRRALERNILDAVRFATAQKRSVEREQPIDGGGKEGALLRNELPGDTSSPSMRAVRNEDSNRLEQAIAGLLADQQLVVRMVHLEGKSLAEAAEKLNRTPAAVAKLLQRGIKNLRAALAEEA